jgi:catalase
MFDSKTSTSSSTELNPLWTNSTLFIVLEVAYRCYSLVAVGDQVLGANPLNYLAAVEQPRLEPKKAMPGMGFSLDKMLPMRLTSYRGALLGRLSVIYDSLRANRPQCPFPTYDADGVRHFDDDRAGAEDDEQFSFKVRVQITPWDQDDV